MVIWMLIHCCYHATFNWRYAIYQYVRDMILKVNTLPSLQAATCWGSNMVKSSRELVFDVDVLYSSENKDMAFANGSITICQF